MVGGCVVVALDCLVDGLTLRIDNGGLRFSRRHYFAMVIGGFSDGLIDDCGGACPRQAKRDQAGLNLKLESLILAQNERWRQA